MNVSTFPAVDCSEEGNDKSCIFVKKTKQKKTALGLMF